MLKFLHLHINNFYVAFPALKWVLICVLRPYITYPIPGLASAAIAPLRHS